MLAQGQIDHRGYGKAAFGGQSHDVSLVIKLTRGSVRKFFAEKR
jgi:hypothetical protein